MRLGIEVSATRHNFGKNQATKAYDFEQVSVCGFFLERDGDRNLPALCILKN